MLNLLYKPLTSATHEIVEEAELTSHTMQNYIRSKRSKSAANNRKSVQHSYEHSEIIHYV